jgi:hypothetical protein
MSQLDADRDTNPDNMITPAGPLALRAGLELVTTRLAVSRPRRGVATGGVLATSGPLDLAVLEAAAAADERAAAIAAVRAGEFVTVEATAVMYWQKDGSPNRNYLRFKSSKLSRIAKTFRRAPVLLDHRQRYTDSRQGTILSSSASSSEDGRTEFVGNLHIVKRAAVEGVLDGTLDQLSIGWILAQGANVTCSVHGTPVWDGCECWPGDSLELDDGPRIVEYEFGDAEGVEVSFVNVPARTGAGLKETRAALALELNYHPRRSQPMSQLARFATLAAALGVTLGEGATLDEAAGVAAATNLTRERDAARAERDTYRLRAEAAEGELETLRKAAVDGKLEQAINAAYADGRLVRQRDAAGAAQPDPIEATLRALAAAATIDAAIGHLAALPKRAGLAPTSPDVPAPARGSSNPHNAKIEQQLGLEPGRLSKEP